MKSANRNWVRRGPKNWLFSFDTEWQLKGRAKQKPPNVWAARLCLISGCYVNGSALPSFWISHSFRVLESTKRNREEIFFAYLAKGTGKRIECQGSYCNGNRINDWNAGSTFLVYAARTEDFNDGTCGEREKETNEPIGTRINPLTKTTSLNDVDNKL